MRKMSAASWIMAAIMTLALRAHAESNVQRRPVPLHGGSAQVAGSISGRQTIDYEFESTGAQIVAITFKSAHKMAYFNLLPPQSEEAIFIGSVSGAQFLGELRSAGTYRIRVYLMRAAARRDETALFTLRVSLRAANKQALPPGASQQVRLREPVPRP